jgi:Xaa-Pro aminopeptidase
MTEATLTTDLARRLHRAAGDMAGRGLDALLITPGPDLRYLTGYQALPLERLTCLVLPAQGDPVLIVPALEEAAAKASPVGDLGLGVRTWQETEDPYAVVADLLPDSGAVGVDNHMWAEQVLRIRSAAPGMEQRLAGEVLAPLRMRKSPAEVAALRRAGAAIDSVHAAMDQWLRAGRTEAAVAADIADAIRGSGHATVDFVIVGSGPNGASPHHEVSDRVIQRGEPVVVDIGGTMPDGYCSDETRMYCVGEPPAQFLEYSLALEQAQWLAVQHVRPGVTCESVDATARDSLTEAGWGEYFIHRTGHGIGLETHEEPYIVAGNTVPLQAGFAFSVEPGVYLPGRHGARIEDIVVCGADGPDLMNHRPRSLVELD